MNKEFSDFSAVFAQLEGIHQIIKADPPRYTVIAVTTGVANAMSCTENDLVGKAFFDAFPQPKTDQQDGEESLRNSFEFVIEHKKKHVLPRQRYDVPDSNGNFKESYWSASNKPFFGANGNVEFIIHSATDITDKVKAERSEQKLNIIDKAHRMFIEAPVAICILKGSDYVVELANDAMLEILGRTRSMIGKVISESLTEVHEQGFIVLLDKVRTTGVTQHVSNFPATILINGVREERFFDIVLKIYGTDEKSGEATRIFCLAHNVTEQVNDRRKIQEVTDSLNFKNAVYEAQNEATPDGVLIIDDHGKILLYNRRFLDIWKIPVELIDEKLDSTLLGYAKNQVVDPDGFESKINSVYKAKHHTSFDELIFNDGRIIERNGNPVRGSNGHYYGWAWYFRDVTDRRKQEQRFRNVVEQAPDPILILMGEELVLEVANQPLLDLWQVGKEALNKPFLEILPEMKDQVFVSLLLNVLRTGEPFFGTEIPAVFKRADNTEDTRYVNFSYQPYREADGRITGVLVLATDVTGQVVAKQQLVENEKNFRNMILQSPVAMCILKGPSFIVEIANDRMYELWGKSAEEISGKPLFEGLPEVRNQGFEKLLHDVFTTGERFIASELAVSLPRKGKNETVFANFVYEPFREGDGTISGVMAVAVDVTEQVNARHKIELSENELQQRVKERTAELESKNQELEQYAYISSHDLQEPLRKIKVFRSMIKEKDYENLSDSSRVHFDKIGDAVERMSSLLTDLLNFASLDREDPFKKTDLNEIIKAVLQDLELVIDQKSAMVYREELPEITAIPLQMQQLFYNLLNNALKFTRPDVKPEIKISAEVVDNISTDIPDVKPADKYACITISDNGIGFDQESTESIFSIFKRLHSKQQYSGSGIGLALVKKIVTNHGGFIEAYGELDKGASFKVFFPLA